jgi:hypothetical protein
MDHWIQWISGEVKAECLSTLTSSGGIVVIRFGSTGVIDLMISDFDISRVGVWRNLRLGDLELRNLDTQNLTQSGPSDRGNPRFVDLRRRSHEFGLRETGQESHRRLMSHEISTRSEVDPKT